MKRIKIGNILDAKGLIIHGVNCQGVMGSGVARDIRAKWPKVFETYSNLTNYNTGTKSSLLGITQFVGVEDDVVVVNLFSQEHFGSDGKKYVSYHAIQKGFTDIANHLSTMQDPMITINYPMIGAGLGGGDWNIISEIIDTAFLDLPNIERVLWVKE